MADFESSKSISVKREVDLIKNKPAYATIKRLAHVLQKIPFSYEKPILRD